MLVWCMHVWQIDRCSYIISPYLIYVMCVCRGTSSSCLRIRFAAGARSRERRSSLRGRHLKSDRLAPSSIYARPAMSRNSRPESEEHGDETMKVT